MFCRSRHTLSECFIERFMKYIMQVIPVLKAQFKACLQNPCQLGRMPAALKCREQEQL